MDLYLMVNKNVNLVMLFFMNHMLRKSNRCAIYSSQDDKKLEQNYERYPYEKSLTKEKNEHL